MYSLLDVFDRLSATTVLAAFLIFLLLLYAAQVALDRRRNTVRGIRGERYPRRIR